MHGVPQSLYMRLGLVSIEFDVKIFAIRDCLQWYHLSFSVSKPTAKRPNISTRQEESTLTRRSFSYHTAGKATFLLLSIQTHHPPMLSSLSVPSLASVAQNVEVEGLLRRWIAAKLACIHHITSCKASRPPMWAARWPTFF